MGGPTYDRLDVRPEPLLVTRIELTSTVDIELDAPRLPGEDTDPHERIGRVVDARLAYTGLNRRGDRCT